jgi:hypothetical protein
MNTVMNGWPYIEAKDYSEWESIVTAFPHLKSINNEEPPRSSNVHGMVIRSANDDNVHKVGFSVM